MQPTRSPWLAMLSITALACQARDQQVGSACSGGACPNATAVQSGLTCLLSAKVWRIALADDGATPGLCLPQPIPTDADGLVDCRLRWRTSDEENAWYEDPQPCDSPSVLPGSQCVVRQLTPAERKAGTSLGWFYSNADGCPRVELTTGAVQPGGEARLECALALARDQNGAMRPIDPSLCAAGEAADADRVGDTCHPQTVPEGGFLPREAYLETPSAECGTDACVIYQLDGDPSPGCAPPANCAIEQDIADSVYCSMRCGTRGGPEDAGLPLRDCPNGFVCVEVLSRGPEALVGGYCVRDLRGPDADSIAPPPPSTDAGSH